MYQIYYFERVDCIIQDISNNAFVKEYIISQGLNKLFPKYFLAINTNNTSKHAVH